MIGYCNNIKSKGVLTCTSALFHAAIASPQVKAICAEIADALEKVKRGEMSREDFETFKAEHKKRLPIITPHATFKNGERKNKDAVPSGLSMFDIDHMEGSPRIFFDEQVKPHLEALGILLAHITPSAEGLRLVFVMPEGMTIAQAQAWMAKQLGLENYDISTKDYARSSFLVPEEYILHLDEKLFCETASPPTPLQGVASPPPPLQGEGSKMSQGANSNEQETQARASNLGEQETQASPANHSPLLGEGSGVRPSGVRLSYPSHYGSIPYTFLVNKLVEQLGGKPEHGSRNTFIFTLACHLRYICDDDAAWIKTLFPTFGEAKEKAFATVDSACNRNQSGIMPEVVKRAIALAKKDVKVKHAATITEAVPPTIPAKLPKLIALLVSRTPDVYKAAVAHAIFPALGAHLWRTRFRYVDNVEHEATLMNVLMAPTGTGKSCIIEPINRIMADIKYRDAENLKRERAWKDACKLKANSKDKPQRPEGLVIQEIDADTTNAAFVMRLAEAEGHFLYMRLNEINLFDSLKGNGKSGQQFRLMCLAFDPGAEYGQTRVGVESVTERVDVRFNWNASTTISNGQRYFSKVLTDGPLSRINFCTIPERECGAEMPVYGTYDATFDELLRPYIENLCKARGLVECPQAFSLAKKMLRENAELARVSQDRVYENLSFRANVIAYLKACVLYVANGCKWEKSIEDFVRWSFKYDMWCKMMFFGAAIDEAESVQMKAGRPGPSNLLMELPDEFTLQDVVEVRRHHNMTCETRAVKHMIASWMNRNYIVIITDNSYSYKKLKYRSDGLDLRKEKV